jgi:glucosamine-6-phosphate deaminase
MPCNEEADSVGSAFFVAVYQGKCEPQGGLNDYFARSMQNPEKIPTVISDDPDALAIRVANRIESIMLAKAAAGQRTVLGLATGSTPIGVYRELIRRHRENGLSFANVETFNLDEYWPMPQDSIHSYHRFMWENFFSHIDIPASQVHLPPGTVDRQDVAAACAAYEAAIAAASFRVTASSVTSRV